MIVLIASLAMVAQDVLGTIMVQAEAANRGWLAGFMDASQWGVGITTATISITAFQGHDVRLKIAVASGVTAANIFGTKLGQMWGKKLLASRKVRMFFAKGDVIEPTLQERIAVLEGRL